MICSIDHSCTQRQILCPNNPYVFVEDGIESALEEVPRPGQKRKLDGRGEAVLIATARRAAADGHEYWTLRLLAGKLVQLPVVEEISEPWVDAQKRAGAMEKGLWCVPKAGGAYEACMEYVPGLYEQPNGPLRPGWDSNCIPEKGPALA